MNKIQNELSSWFLDIFWRDRVCGCEKCLNFVFLHTFWRARGFDRNSQHLKMPISAIFSIFIIVLCHFLFIVNQKFQKSQNSHYELFNFFFYEKSGNFYKNILNFWTKWLFKGWVIFYLYDWRQCSHIGANPKIDHGIILDISSPEKCLCQFSIPNRSLYGLLKIFLNSKIVKFKLHKNN